MNIVRKPKNQKIWVVRSEAGVYFHHFIQGNCVGIGHLDKLKLQPKTIERGDLYNLRKRLETADPDSPKASITSHLNQILSFCEDMQIGDMVVTLNSQWIQFGEITGSPHITRDRIVRKNKRGDEIELTYNLRRSVSWGAHIRRSLANSNLEKSLQAHQTVFNITSHWATIYHTLYPYFADEDNNFYSSLNIGSRNRPISNYELTQLFTMLNGIEAISSLAIENKLSTIQSYDEALRYFTEKHKFKLTTKAEFSSPGTIWSMIATSSPEAVGIFLLICFGIFGGEISLTKIKFNGLSPEAQVKILDLISQLKVKLNFNKVCLDLELSQPKQESFPKKDFEESANSKARQGNKKKSLNSKH